MAKRSTNEGEAKCGTRENEGAGNVTPAADGVPELPPGLPEPHARGDETWKQTWERLRVEARAAGMSKQDAYVYATDAVKIARPEPVANPEPEAPAVPLPPEPESAAPDGLAGLGDLPADWPELPANAALPVEVSWVQSNRLRVRVGEAVDLSRALSPAPSHATLAWLETAILYPAKWADIVAKATQGQVEEKEAVRRERLAIEEVRGLLAEMIEAQEPST